VSSIRLSGQWVCNGFARLILPQTLLGVGDPSGDIVTKEMDYDQFAVYGFQVGYPSTWRVELNPKSEHAKGDVAFKAQDGTRMFVSWGLIDSIQKKFATLDDQVKASVQRIKKDGQIGGIQVLDQKEFQVCGHRAVYTRISATVRSTSLFSKSVGQRELWAAHLRCEKSGRYFVVYGSSQTDRTLEETTEVYNHLQGSFKCPCTCSNPP